MSALRTQIYLTREQRRQLDQIRRTEGASLAAVIRHAIDAYLDTWRVREEEVERVLEETYGSEPGLDVPPRSEWATREQRVRSGGG